MKWLWFWLWWENRWQVLMSSDLRSPSGWQYQTLCWRSSEWGRWWRRWGRGRPAVFLWGSRWPGCWCTDPAGSSQCSVLSPGLSRCPCGGIEKVPREEGSDRTDWLVSHHLLCVVCRARESRHVWSGGREERSRHCCCSQNSPHIRSHRRAW